MQKGKAKGMFLVTRREGEKGGGLHVSMIYLLVWKGKEEREGEERESGWVIR